MRNCLSVRFILVSVWVATNKKPLIIVGIENKIQKDKLNKMGYSIKWEVPSKNNKKKQDEIQAQEVVANVSITHYA